MSRQNLLNHDFPDDAYALVKEASDPSAARAAHRSTTALLDYLAEHLGDRPFLCPLDPVDCTVETYTFRETLRLVIRFAKGHGEHAPPRRKGEKAEVVGVLAAAGADYWLNDRALQRLGHVPLHLSVTLSAPAATSLLETMGVTFLLVGPGGEDLASKLDKRYLRIPWIYIPTAPLLLPGDESTWRTGLTPEEEAEETALIMHTTGSTANPKPIPIRHRPFCNMAWILRPGSKLCLTATSHAWTLYHAHISALQGQAVYIPPPIGAFTAEKIIKVIQAAGGRPDILLVVPIIIKLLLDVPSGLQYLASFKEVHLGGGVLPSDVGAQMTRHGIHLFNLVAATEMALILRSQGDRTDQWDRLQPLPLVAPYLRFDPFDPISGACELIVLPQHPVLFVSNRPDGSYATGDLFAPHPDGRGGWKYERRKEEIIVHSHGLKSDPLAIEGYFQASPLVSRALAIGTGENLILVLVIPASGGISIDSLQPIMDMANDVLPSQSRITPRQVLLFPHDETFVLAPKGTVIRGKTEAKFAEAIRNTYQAMV